LLIIVSTISELLRAIAMLPTLYRAARKQLFRSGTDLISLFI